MSQDAVHRAMKQIAMKQIVILTGAGISAESGLPTFRDKDGLWEGHRFEDVACPAAFRRNPQLVHRFYNMRRAALREVEPNAAHLAIARLQQAFPEHVTLVTQNVDDLHERAGSQEVIHMHGELRKAMCTDCMAELPWEEDILTETDCPACGLKACLRPDIVWFGEMPYHMDRIAAALAGADIFAAIGTSGLVYPAAGFVREARLHGAETIEINAQGTSVSQDFHHHFTGPATIEVPRWVEGLIQC